MMEGETHARLAPAAKSSEEGTALSDDLAHTGYEDNTLSPALATSVQQRQPNPTPPIIESAPHVPQNGTQRLLGSVKQCDDDEDDGVAGLRAELTTAQERWRQVLAMLHEEQPHITKTQRFKPHSTRGEAVSLLLRAIERVALLLHETERTGRSEG
jgi:hypothetical protein